MNGQIDQETCVLIARMMKMIEIFEIIWNSPIELKVIILAGLILPCFVAYYGIRGTDDAIDFQTRLWEEKEWKRKNNIR